MLPSHLIIMVTLEQPVTASKPLFSLYICKQFEMQFCCAFTRYFYLFSEPITATLMMIIWRELRKTWLQKALFEWVNSSLQLKHHIETAIPGFYCGVTVRQELAANRCMTMNDGTIIIFSFEVMLTVSANFFWARKHFGAIIPNVYHWEVLVKMKRKISDIRHWRY